MRERVVLANGDGYCWEPDWTRLIPFNPGKDTGTAGFQPAHRADLLKKIRFVKNLAPDFYINGVG